jgi:dTDP-glucose 4,6-dehydratase
MFLINKGAAVSYPAPGRQGPFSDVPARYNVVGDVELSNLQLAEHVAEILQMRLRYELIDAHSQRPGHDLRYALDGAKIKEAGWSAPVSFQESLQRTVRWYIDNPEWLVV